MIQGLCQQNHYNFTKIRIKGVITSLSYPNNQIHKLSPIISFLCISLNMITKLYLIEILWSTYIWHSAEKPNPKTRRKYCRKIKSRQNTNFRSQVPLSLPKQNDPAVFPEFCSSGQEAPLEQPKDSTRASLQSLELGSTLNTGDRSKNIIWAK